MYELKTNKNVDEAIEALESSLKNESFGILWQLNFKDKLIEKGLTFEEDFVVLEVCNPKQAKEVLAINPHVGYVLPCKMVVRTENGQTYIGMTNPEVLIGLFEEAELNKISKEIVSSLEKAIQASV